MRQNIILIGYMGSGKTTIGRKLASNLGFRFVDTDELVREHSGKTIPEIFQEQGEEAFRDFETDVLKSVINSECQIISTGGGLVLREENRMLLKDSGFCVWLKANPDTIYERICRNGNRPLLETENPRQTIYTMLQERTPKYLEAANMEIATDHLGISDLAYGIAESAKVFFRKQALEACEVGPDGTC